MADAKEAVPPDKPSKSKTTFLDLPRELRNSIYHLSGCLTYYEHSSRFNRVTVRGDYTPARHAAIHGCSRGSECPAASWNTFLTEWNKAFILVNARAAKEPRPMLSSTHKGVSTFSSTWHGGRRCRGPNRPVQSHEAFCSQPPLTHVCKTVRDETLSIFYGGHPFVFRLMSSDLEMDADKILKWLNTIGTANAGRLKDIIIVYSKKKALRYVTRTLLPEMRRLGVNSGYASVELVRLEYPIYSRGSDMAILKGLRPRW